MFRVHLYTQEGDLTVVPGVDSDLTIGSAEDNGIVLRGDDAIAPRQANLRVHADRLYVENLGRAHGCIHNGVPFADTREVRIGDWVSIGGFRMQFLAGRELRRPDSLPKPLASAARRTEGDEANVRARSALPGTGPKARRSPSPPSPPSSSDLGPMRRAPRRPLRMPGAGPQRGATVQAPPLLGAKRPRRDATPMRADASMTRGDATPAGGLAVSRPTTAKLATPPIAPPAAGRTATSKPVPTPAIPPVAAATAPPKRRQTPLPTAPLYDDSSRTGTTTALADQGESGPAWTPIVADGRPSATAPMPDTGRASGLLGNLARGLGRGAVVLAAVAFVGLAVLVLRDQTRDTQQQGAAATRAVSACQRALASGRFDAAEETAQTALRLSPGHADAERCRARAAQGRADAGTLKAAIAALAKRDWAGARAQFGVIDSESPVAQLPAFTQAHRAMVDGRLSEAGRLVATDAPAARALLTPLLTLPHASAAQKGAAEALLGTLDAGDSGADAPKAASDEAGRAGR